MQGDEISHLLGGLCQKTKFGQHLTIRNWYSSPEFADPAPAALDLLTRNKDEALSRKTRAALENPGKWLFLDTETTGLAGGTGTYAFLTGIAWWDAGGLQVEQLFMRDFTEEHSVLCELAERIAERPVLVTFNGKTFDWPLLQSRFTMTRRIPAPKLATHLDLLHPARALWKLRLGSVRLTDLERLVLDAERLGWRREDDVASALIPQFYFDYLRGGSAAQLAGVVRHNQMDLRGLAALFGKINSVLAAEEPPKPTAETCSDSRAFCTVAAKHQLKNFVRRRLQPACRPNITNRLRENLRSWPSVAATTPPPPNSGKVCFEGNQNAIEACEQLAIHFEHREKNLQLAVEYVQLGLAKLCSGGQRLRDPYAEARFVRWETSLRHRQARLEQRLATSQPPLQPERRTAATAGRLL